MDTLCTVINIIKKDLRLLDQGWCGKLMLMPYKSSVPAIGSIVFWFRGCFGAGLVHTEVMI